MKCLHIIYVYQRIKKDPECITTPITFIFAAKAAPGYTKAKEIIRLIHSVAEMVNKDPDMKGKIQVVFVEDYCVSVAEMLIPAADISEQISTARNGSFWNWKYEIYDERSINDRNHGRSEYRDR